MLEITSRKNPLIAHLRKLGASREYRYQSREFLCDGVKLLREAIACGAEIQNIVTCRDDFDPGGDTACCRVPFELIEYISPLKNPQDVVFSCRMPQYGAEAAPGGRYIILDGIQDPGNVGAIIRAASAFDFDGVMLTGGCADPYNPKTVRSTMGAIFWQKVTEVSLRDVAAMKDAGIRLCGAAPRGDSRDVGDAALHGAAVAIGSEGRGLSDDVLSLCDELIRIPMSPRSESLNAAAAASIIMWEIYRKK